MAVPSILLLQARVEDDPMREHEAMCFAEQSKVPREQFTTYDLLQGPPDMATVKSYDLLMVGGSGDYYVSRGNLPQQEAFLDLLRQVASEGHPTFGSCYGYQSLVQALGGTIIYDPENTEVGTFELKLSEAGKEDPLFGGLPETFLAQMGHKDRALHHPEGIPNLCASERAPFQGIRVPGQPIWAAQFHPELSRATNLERFDRYAEGYARFMPEEERLRARETFRPSPEASALLERFVGLVFSG